MPATRTTSTQPRTWIYTISGEAYEQPHEEGDPVPSDVPESKLKEWARAGVIKPAPKVKKAKVKDGD